MGDVVDGGTKQVVRALWAELARLVLRGRLAYLPPPVALRWLFSGRGCVLLLTVLHLPAPRRQMRVSWGSLVLGATQLAGYEGQLLKARDTSSV